MTIQIVNLSVPNGDTPRSANTKINANFSNPTHAASRLAGLEGSGNAALSNGRLVEYSDNSIGSSGVGGSTIDIGGAGMYDTPSKLVAELLKRGSCAFRLFDNPSNPSVVPFSPSFFIKGGGDSGTYAILNISHLTGEINVTSGYEFSLGSVLPVVNKVYSSSNTTKDANGFLKGASPVVDMYDNKIGLNHDAERQGGITFEKLGVGDYLVKGSLGFAQEGWYIETPKDANGNVLVAVVYKQLANNDLSIKTYAKRFDEETGDVVANLLKPRDIPAGRFISLRLHELPKEPPVMPTPQTEV